MERLVLPRQRSRRGESYGDGSIIPSVDPGYDVGRGNIEAPERLQLARTDFEKCVAVLPCGQVQCGIAADDIAGILGGLGPKCDAESDIALRLTQRRQVQTLATQGEEDIAATTLLPDMDHKIDPIGVVVKEFEVLVNDDQQDGDRFQVPASESHFLILVRVTCTGILE